jgi:Putative phage tail protein
MAQLAIMAVGAAIGGAIAPGIVAFGMTGGAIGWALGGLASSLLIKPKYQKPPVGDLDAPQVQYGSPVPMVFGVVATAGSLAWMSDKRATEETTEVGKGGSDTVTTGYTYSADMKFVLAVDSGVGARLLRVWRNGKLVWSARAGATEETLIQSETTDLWDAIELRDGNPAQMPWAIYEAAVGTANAAADRHCYTVCITNARFGGSPTPPSYLFEIATDATDSPGNILLLSNMEGGTITDESGYAHTYTLSAVRADTPGLYGSYALWLNSGSAGGSAAVTPGAGTVSFSLSQDFTAECAVYVSAAHNGQIRLLDLRVNGGDQVFEARLDCNIDGSCDLELSFLTNPQEQTGITLAYATWNHVEIGYEAATQTCTLYFNGAPLLSSVFSGSLPTYTHVTSMQPIEVDSSGSTWPDGWARVDGIRYTRGYLRHTEAFTPPSTAPTADIASPSSPNLVDLEDVCTALALRCPPLTAATLDFSALAGIQVRGFAAVGSVRQALEQLASAYYFGFVVSDKLYSRLRGGSSAATLPYADLGAGADGASDEPLELERGNDNEVPRKVALTYVNINSDHEHSTVTGDRGAGPEGSQETAELSLVLTPAEAQEIADAWAADRRVAATTFKPAVTDYYAALEPTDVITLTDSDGSTYRARIVAEDYQQGVKTLECVLDDASVLTQPGLASDYLTPTISIPLTSETTLRLMDIPLLRDADNDPGYYFAVARSISGGAWPGASVVESASGAPPWTSVATVTSEAVMGTATTALGDWAGGNVMDHRNSVTISINGTAASFTDDQVLAGAARAWLIGDEIVIARTASLVSAGVYTLSNLMRARQGTEWATGSHVIGERVVALDQSLLRRGSREAGQLDVAYTFVAPTFGRAISSAATQSFADTGEALRPLSPADVEIDRDSSNNATITVRRRTRLSHRFLREGIDTPLGEADESYSVDAYTDGTYTTVAATFTFTGASGSFTAAAQTTAGLTPGDPLYLAVHQLSAVVGRGHEKRAAA